jgi:hypothetical protein
MVENFHQSKSQLLELEDQLDSSKYFRAHIGVPETAHLDYWVGEQYTTDRLDDGEGARWYQMLLGAMVHSVENYDERYEFNISENLDGKSGTTDRATYIHAPGEITPIYECKDEYRKLPCGYCVVSLEKDWWISVRWYKYNPDKSIVDAYYGDRISFEEYESQNSRAIEECEIRGAAAIGYEYRPIKKSD